MAFTPQVAAASWIPVLVAAVLRRWWIAGVALAAAVALAVAVLPRAFAGPNPDIENGVPLRVMSSNLRLGFGSANAVVDLVRAQRIQVLAAVEITPPEVIALDKAGLKRLMPYRVDRARFGAAGTTIFSAFPLRPLVAHPTDAPNAQSAARLRIPGAPPIELQAEHPRPPLHGDVAQWRHVLEGAPGPSPGRTLRMLLGDFNATLDQHDFRRLLDRGYVDAADATGQGLDLTWPVGHRVPPAVAIDHVLIDPRIAARAVSTHDIASSDHRAVIADLELPRVRGSAP